MSIVTTKRESLGRGLGRPFAYLGAEWERMAPRERRWVAALVIAIAVVAVLLGTYFVFSNISDLEEGNADIREALDAIAKHRGEYLDAKSRSAAQEARIGNDPPQLTADLEAAAREEQVKIEESRQEGNVETLGSIFFFLSFSFSFEFFYSLTSWCSSLWGVS